MSVIISARPAHNVSAALGRSSRENLDNLMRGRAVPLAMVRGVARFSPFVFVFGQDFF